MKKSILILMSVMFSYSVFANDLVPVAVQSSTPNQTWFYNLEDVVFDADDSYVPNGYIMTTKWYINGVYQPIPNYFDLSVCFALPGSPAGDCYQLVSGQTTVQIKLEVQSNSGYWHSETLTYTIQEHKGRKYFVKDHLGNVRTTVNRDGNVLGFDDYYPFGQVMPGRSNNTANPNDNYKFIGEELDDEAGLTLMNLNARTYDPITGRFNQIDPLFDHPNQIGLSPYNYSWNNPMNLSDPTGECPWCPPAVAGGTGLAATGAAIGAAIGATVAYLVIDEIQDNQGYFEHVGSAIKEQVSGVWDSAKSLFSSDAKVTGDVATDATTSENSDPMITLYRGVEADHPGFELAKQGIAVPRGGPATPGDHNAGDTESIYTSWSTQQSVANYYANGTGVVLTKSFKPSQIVPSPNGYGEGEVLVPGVVTGAQVSSPSGRVWDPIKGN